MNPHAAKSARIAAVVVALAAVGWFAARRVRDRRHAASRDAVVRAVTHARALERCLVGDVAPLSPAALASRARRVALHPDADPRWPSRCAPHARALGDVSDDAPPPLVALRGDARALASALDDGAALEAQAFRRGASAPRFERWTAPAARVFRAARAISTSWRAPPARVTEAPARALPAVSGDVLPVSVAAGSVVAGSSYAAGTLSVLFLEPTHERVLCRTRDRGATVACRRFEEAQAPRYLLGNDDAEALLLRAPAAGTTEVSSADAPERPVFTAPAPVVQSLAARVAGGDLHVVLDRGARASLARCARGGACREAPLDAPPSRESVLLSTGRAVWWVGVGGGDAPALEALRVDATPPAPALRLTTLRSGATLLASCHAHGVAWAVASDTSGSYALALEGDGPPRLLGPMGRVDLPLTLACDARGVTAVGRTRSQSCAREGRCGEVVPREGEAAVARVEGEVVTVAVSRDGGDGLRVHRAPADGSGAARTSAVDDDEAHGGLSARAVWLFEAGGNLVLVASGSTTAVLWSSDRGATWQPSREAGGPLRPARLGTLPR